MSEKTENSQKFPKSAKRIQTHPYASGCIRMSLKRSEWVRMGLNTFGNLEKLATTSNKPAKTSKNFANMFTKTFFTALYELNELCPIVANLLVEGAYW